MSSYATTQPAYSLPKRETGGAEAAATLRSRRTIASAAWHSLLWLVVANCVGVLIAAMLLLPDINGLLAPLSYGRWMPVHINLQLYGWCSLPLVAFLLFVYKVDSPKTQPYVQPVLWVWSAALFAGSLSWLSGHSSGKLFLDWTGYVRVLFPLALLTLWALLTLAFFADEVAAPRRSLQTANRMVKGAGLLLLLLVPFLIYFAASPTIYPPINPDTGGPTGASQLESTLVIIAILLLLPFGLVQREPRKNNAIKAAWIVFTIEALLCLGLGRADASHHRPTQWISLGSLLLWIPLIPAYYNAFQWHPATRRWRIAFLAWWSVLVPTGWMLFLPGVLDHFKFTDGLVGHSLLAMAGFVSSLLIFVLVELLGDDGWIFNTSWSFYLWHGCVLAYVIAMFFAGWREGSEPAFSILPGLLRNSLYTLRFLLGLGILVASADWFLDSISLMQQLNRPQSMATPGDR